MKLGRYRWSWPPGGGLLAPDWELVCEHHAGRSLGVEPIAATTVGQGASGTGPPGFFVTWRLNFGTAAEAPHRCYST
jgi:hypothetical protein